MSHVDEGTLHAYLDGELTPVERERVDTHVKGCPACQARLAEERALIERASRLLGMATPPERAMLPLAQLRQRRLPWWQVRRPLAWAATLILAVGLGWFARGAYPGRVVTQREAERDQVGAAAPAHALARTAQPTPAPDSGALALEPRGYLSTRQAGRLYDSMGKDRDALQRQLESAEVATGALASNGVARRDTTSAAGLVLKADANAQLPTAAPPTVKVRGYAPAVPPEQQRPAAVPAPQQTYGADAASGVVTLDGSRARRASVLMSTSWPLIARQPARDVLGVDPAVIPGFAVRAYRRNPATREIAVEQVTDAGTTISLIERPVEGSVDERQLDSGAANAPRSMAKAANERLARFVGPLRIEIEGPLTPDSLSHLLELAR